MALEKTDEELKRYYSIGEVAEKFGIKPSVIRFWETSFDFLKPHKNAKGDRRFTKANLEQIRIIHHLVKERGFTLEGARKEIAARKKEVKQRLVIIDQLKQTKARLLAIKEGL